MRQLVKDALGWGLFLWFIGYMLGIIFFFIVPKQYLGWIILPIGIAITLWVLVKKIKVQSLRYYIKIAVVWSLIAILCDYFFLVRIFKPADGYYKLDVYLYYALTFLLPLFMGWKKTVQKI
jgi:hypothetical protein